MSQRSHAEQFSVQLIHEQASRLASLYSNYQSWLPSAGRNEHLELMFGDKLLGLFKWVDSHPEAQKLLQDYHQRELENEQISTIDNPGPFIPYQDPAEEARLFLDGIDNARSSILGGLFQEMARWNGYDLAGQVWWGDVGANLGELFLAGTETVIEKAENKEHVKMADPGPGEKLYAKGKREHIDPKSFEPLGQGLPGYKTFNPNETEESENDKEPQDRESEDRGSERMEKPSQEKSEHTPTSPNQEPNYSSRDGREIYVPPNGEPNFTSPEGKPVQVPANRELNFTPPEAPQIPAHAEGQPLSTSTAGDQNFTPASSTSSELQQGPQQVEGKPSGQPEGNLNYTPPEGKSSNNPDGGHKSDARGYGGGSSDTRGYNGSSSDAGGYDGGYSDAGGYDAGSSDAAKAPEGGGEAGSKRG
jgi:hypothetical protein